MPTPLDLRQPKNDLSSIKVATAAFMQWLSQSWSSHFGDDRPPLPIYFARNPDDLRSMKPQIDGKLSYPFAITTWTLISQDDRKAAAARRFTPPRVTDRSQQESHVELTTLIPLRLGLGLQFRTDNLDQVIDFANIYMRAAPIFSIHLVSSESGLREEYAITLEPELQVPVADGEQGKEFRYDTTVSINCNLKVRRYQGVIRKVRLEIYNQHMNQQTWQFENLLIMVEDAFAYTDLFDVNNERYAK